ncbi:MAG: NAD(P)H-dependent oxidoreductase [Kofleriaceae bacterium]|nr:NAD(P)H-dependent oxidoreductase [Myxococcales bacterium]MCB9563004.1 NAD(P)H-dependent oxidoreductase [Kofleriaceae bacterium]
MAQLQLLGIAGSLRKASYNRALIRAIGEELPDGATLSLYDGLAALPVFDPDSKDNPDVVIAFQEAIRAADGLVIATPEYNYSISGLLKNALDWATRPLKTSPMRGKPVGIASASTGISGGMRAQYHLRQILVFTDSPAMLQPEVIIPRAQDRFDADGRLTDDSTRDLLRRYAGSLTAWVGRFHG